MKRVFSLFLALTLVFALGACGDKTEPGVPSIDLQGDTEITLIQGHDFTDLGAIAEDDEDGTLDVVVTGTVDTDTVGTYTLTYTATDVDGNEATATRTVTIVYEQGVTATTILVGNAAATSGALQFVGEPFNAGIEAYFDMVNAAGGVGGREIEFVHYDDEFSAANGITFTEKLVEDDEIFSFVGHFGTPTVSATIDYLNEVGIPRVYYATGISALFNEAATGGEAASFPVQPIYDAEGQVMVARASAEFGATTIGVIYTSDDAGLGMINGIRLQATTLGITLEEAQVLPTDTDMSSAALTVKDADVVIVAANQIPAEVAIKALAAAGGTSPVITSYVNAAASFVENISAELESFDVYSSAWLNFFEADGVTPTADYTLFATEISKIDPLYAANAYAMAGWIAAAVFVEGLERVGDDALNWDTFIAAMEESPVVIPMGGLVDYANGSRVGTQAMSMLQANVDNTDPANPVYSWVPFQDMEDISSILGE